jgi:sugar lactone lactonase YvrE
MKARRIMHLVPFLSSRVTIDRPTSSRGAIVALLVLSLMLLAPAGATVSAQETASPAASPAPSAGGQFIARFDAEAGELSEGVTVDADGTVYASLSPLGQLVRIGSGGEYEVVGTVEGLQEGDIGMLGLTAHPDGSVYAGVFSANPDAHGVWRFDVDTGEAERVPGTEQIGLPNAIAFAADGAMYVTDTITGAVWLVPLDGTAEQWLQHSLLEGDESIGFPFPAGANGIALDEAGGTVYVSVLEKGTLLAIPIEDDGSAGEPAVHTEFTDAQDPVLVDGIVLDAVDNLYVAQPAVNTVVRVTPAGAIETVATQADGLDGPASVAVAPDADGTERLYVSNFSVALAPLVAPGGAGPGIVMIPLGD